MADKVPRILLGDTHPDTRTVLEVICREQGWEFTAVESSFQILRMLRDASDIALVMVDPELPGSGISGKEVAKTIKTSGQFGAIPVVFVLHEGVAAPEGIAVNGTVQIATAGPARVLAAMREAMGVAADSRVAAPQPVDEAPRVVATTASRAAAVAPVPAEAPAQSARILVADTVATARTVLEPLCEHQGWVLTIVESGFQALRVVRDTDVDLVLINPQLQAAGVSGADIARTIKSAAQFRKLPVVFLLHEGGAVPEGAKVDGAVEVDAWPTARLVEALTAAMRRSPGTAESGSVPAQTSAVPVDVPAASPEQFRGLRDELLTETRRIVDAALRAFAQIEGRTVAEAAVHRYAATEGRSLAEQLTALNAAVDEIRQGAADASPSGWAAGGEIVEVAVRQYLEGEGRAAAEQLLAALAQQMLPAIAEPIAREMLPAIAERLAWQHMEQAPGPAASAEELTPQFREEVLEAARRAAAAASRQEIQTEGRTVLEAALRQYLAGEGRAAAEQLVASLGQELLPAMAERLARQHMEQAPGPAASGVDLGAQFREEVLETARRAAAAASRQQIETEGRTVLEAALRQYLAGEGRAVAERLVASLGQEMLPAMAERLARQQLEQLPGTLAARVEALVPQLREQMLETARRTATAATRQQIEVEGRGALEAAIRQYLASEGGGLAERLVETLAGEAVPAIAERLVQRELDRLPNPAVKLEELLAHLREQLREDARRGVETIARRYVESSGRAVVEEVVRQYAGSQGAEVAEEVVRAATREIVPTIAERLVQRELERLPGPAAKVEEVLAQLREQLREDARRAIETIARRYAETDGRATVESVIRQYVATQGVGLADDFVRAAAREIVPTVAERLVQREIAHLPPAAARIEEVLAQLREQLREDGRHAIETMARRYAETEGRRAIEAVIRQAGPPGGAVAEDLVRSVAREVVPTIAERLIREEIARLRREVRPG